MTPKQIAEALNGCEYPDIGSKEVFAQAAEKQIVIVFGHSDDLMEFRGAIYDEVDACDGGVAMLSNYRIHRNHCDEGDDCPNWQGHPPGAIKVEAIWCAEGEPAWTFNADTPGVETFEVMEEGEVFQRGIVFAL